MFISKKKLVKYIEKLQAANRGYKLGQDYELPISEEQKRKNIYLQGYEDGTDNFFNSICEAFELKSRYRVTKK